MNYSKGERKAIHLALEETDGVLKDAAKLVGMTINKLNYLIKTDPEFNVRWGNGDVKVPT
jgi:transcriptional regulator with GAF, ATPase, and Fis domain